MAIPRHRQSNCICTVMLNIYYFSVHCFILCCTCVCWCDSVEDGIIVSQWADDSVSAISAARVGVQLSVRACWTWTCPVQRCMMFTVDFFYLCPHLCICLTVSGITRKTAGGFLWNLGNRSTVYQRAVGYILEVIQNIVGKKVLKLEAKDVLPNINRTQLAKGAEQCRFLSLVTLTFRVIRVRVQMSSVWIWHKSVQQFQRYFIHKQKTTDWWRQKQNLPQFTVCSKNWHQRDLYPATIAQQDSMLPFCHGVSQQHCLQEAVLAYPVCCLHEISQNIYWELLDAGAAWRTVNNMLYFSSTCDVYAHTFSRKLNRCLDRLEVTLCLTHFCFQSYPVVTSR